MRISGQLFPPASGLTICTSTPNHSAMAAVRRSWVMRSGLRASIRPADLFPAHGMPRFLLQTGVQFRTVLVDLGHAIGRAEPADQPGGMPGGAPGDFILFQEDDVVASEKRQVVGHAGAGDAAADNDDFGLGREGSGHFRPHGNADISRDSLPDGTDSKLKMPSGPRGLRQNAPLAAGSARARCLRGDKRPRTAAARWRSRTSPPPT